MSLSVCFPFWVAAEQKRQPGLSWMYR